MDCDSKQYLSLIERNKNNFISACYESIFAGTSHLPDLILLKSQKIKSPVAQTTFKALLIDCVAKAILFNNKRAVQTLCNYIDVNEPIDDKKTTLLMLAAYNPDIEMAKSLLEYGADLQVYDSSYKSVFMHAASANNVPFMKLLLKMEIGINAKNNEKQTALLYAICAQAIEAIKFLIKKGINVNHQTLLCAIKTENNDIIETLLTAGGSITAECLSQAISNNDPQLLDRLLNKVQLVDIGEINSLFRSCA